MRPAVNASRSRQSRQAYNVSTRFTERAQGVSLVKAFGGFADGCNEVNPDSEQNEPAKPQGLKVSFCERGANPRRIAPSAK